MKIDPCKPGWWRLLHGEGEPVMQVITWFGTVILSALFLAEAIHLIID